ncbi:carbohydrate-binding module family 48 protein [Aaosphaeria arxii CBS 175.79]|uniref:Carbohydrate-binding module family 48 protein n=1 Tax=Aaosphaeria arxii CBS 175.79 TaxID=1450172 RepID=A0A6A5Y4Q1_9PLEO|nr:carbohydrate-binding module family 48 protein [Aaosphaeria arxii CBS 175.79]KAF2020239.1 carbohydrate-binding module family 48 protein [Aaosphaeria arxii CBS 175.79]
MGSYTFTWAHAANEVYVTGDFDDWKQTVKLEKEDGVFQKTVELPKAKTAYKFVVDGQWVTNDSHPSEDDGKGNHNNVLVPDDIKDETAHTLSSAAPASTTAALAGAVPKEEKPVKAEESLPGAFPITPAAATPGSEPQTFAVNPIPATSGLGNPVDLAPGEKVPEPSTLTDNTVESTVNKDGKEPEEEKVSVAPIPATAGAGNPITLAPGEKVPDASTLTTNTVSSTVNTDEASYEKSDALPPQLGPVVTPEAERDAKGGMFALPSSLAGSLIPESSLPKDTNAETEKDPGVTIQSAAPTSTTAALAGEVPKEPREVPEAVVESQKEAGFTPEASANPEAVVEKKEVEEELKAKVPEEPATSESPSATQQTAEKVGAAAVAGATVAAGAVTAAAYTATNKAADTIGVYNQEPAAGVPEVVADSQKEAHVSPEAAANPEAVVEKKEVEEELLSKAGATTETAAPAAAVPAVVGESLKEAHASPEAAVNAEAVEEKKAVEQELLKEVKPTNESGEPAPAVTAATSASAPGAVEEAPKETKTDGLNASAAQPAVPETSAPVQDSRDVSPMSKPATHEQTQPTVVTGTENSTTEAKTSAAPETPKKDTPSSAKAAPESVASGATTDKKKKRRSFFGKIKDKLSSKN